jgi:hypothetical protein
MATKNAKPSKSTAVVPWEAEMAARAQKAAAAAKVRGLTKKISTRGGILSIDDTPVEDNELRVVILSAIPENQYYISAYNPNQPAVPVCYAFGTPDADDPEADMAPSDDVADKQGDEDGRCAHCWANKMGSADVGRGKACKNIYRVAVITEDALESAEDLRNAEVRMLNVPVMSVKNLTKYINKLNDDMSRPPEAVITLLKVVPDAKSQFQVTFRFEELINFDGDLWDAMKAKRAEVNKDLTAPYPKQEDLDAANQAKPVRAHGKLGQKMTGPGKGAAAPTKRAGGKF